MNYNKLLPLLFLLLAGTPLFGQRPSFFQESIDFELDAEWFTVNGLYFLANSTDERLRSAIYFPLAVRTDSIRLFKVLDVTKAERLDVKVMENGFFFHVWMMPRDTIVVNIEYAQPTRRVNEYVLESTQTWGQALKKAAYSLTVDDNLRVDSLSLSPDSISGQTYFWSRNDFFPSENFCVWVEKFP